MTVDMTAAKAVVSAVGLIATALSSALADNVFNSDDAGAITTIITVGLSVYAVWATPNKPKPVQPPANEE